MTLAAGIAEDERPARVGDLNDHLVRLDQRLDQTNARIDAVRSELSARIDAVHQDLLTRLDELRRELTARSDQTNMRIDELRRELIEDAGLTGSGTQGKMLGVIAHGHQNSN